MQILLFGLFKISHPSMQENGIVNCNRVTSVLHKHHRIQLVSPMQIIAKEVERGSEGGTSGVVHVLPHELILLR